MNYTNNMLTEYKDVLLPEEVQEILRTGRNTVYSYLKDGIIRSIMVGGKYRIPKQYLLDYLYSDKTDQEGDGYNGKT